MDLKIKLKKINETLKDLVLVSTFHGLPIAVKTERVFLKVLWISLFVIFTIIALSLVYISILEYLKYNVVTTINIINESQTLFPAITFYSLKHSKFNKTLDDVVISCKFNDKSCGLNNFETKYDEIR